MKKSVMTLIRTNAAVVEMEAPASKQKNVAMVNVSTLTSVMIAITTVPIVQKSPGHTAWEMY